MNEVLLQNAMALFDTPDKWNAFQELVNISGNIQNRWWKKLQQEVLQREMKNGNPNWDILVWDYSEIKWFIKEYGKNSLSVYFCGKDFNVFAGDGFLDVNKLAELLKDFRFNAIGLCFDRKDGNDRNTIGWETRNFSFGTPSDGNFPTQLLSWYAGHKTEEFANQIITKVRRFQTPEINALFKEINDKCKKDV